MSGDVLIGINPPPNGADEEIGYPRSAFTRLRSDGTVLDTVFVPERYAEECPVRSNGWFRRGWHEDVRVPYIPKTKWTMRTDGRMVAGCPATYAFDVLDPDGARLRVSRVWESVIASREELDAFVDVLTVESNRAGGFPKGWSFRGPDLPRERPAYPHCAASRIGAASSAQPRHPDPFIRGDTVWAVTVDSLEVNYLTRFEVEWP